MIKIGCCLPGGSFMPQGEAAIPDSVESKILYGGKILKEAKYDYAEISAGFIESLTDEEVNHLSSLREKENIMVETANCFIPGRFSIYNEEQWDELEKYVDMILSRASRLGVKIMVFGSGGARNIPENISREEGMKYLKKFLRMCNEYAVRHQVTIAIEPLNSKECNVFNTVGECAPIVRELNLPGIRLLADAFHMYMENEDLRVLEEVGDILVHTHVAEPPERVYPGKNGGEYLKQFAQKLKKINYHHRLSVECSFNDFLAEIDPSYAFLENILR